MRSVFLWVDEDERIWAPERKLLLGLGTKVEAVSDATLALGFEEGVLSGEYPLLILDVMLLQGDNTTLFSDSATNHGRDTGLVLAKYLCAKDPLLGRRILFFSRATERSHVSLIASTCRELNAFYLKKGPQTQGVHFVHWLREHGFIGRDTK